MGTILNVIAMEKSTLVVHAAFADEDGNPVVPDSIQWTLTNGAGDIINNRENVAVTPPAAEIDIVLTGNDLQVSTDPARWVTVAATYTSTLGSGLPLTAAAMFVLENLTGVS